MISEELLSLLGYGKVISEIEPTKAHDMDCLSFRTERYIDDGRSENKKVRISEHFIISVDTIGNKCKEWAYNEGYEIKSSIGNSFNRSKKGFYELYDLNTKKEVDDIYCTIEEPETNTEIEAILKACQHVLNRKG